MSNNAIFLGLDNPQIIDLRILAVSLGDDVPMLCDFIKTQYLLSAQQGLTDVKEAIALNDTDALKKIGHKYKSSAKTVGALVLADLFFRLERLPDDNSIAFALTVGDAIEAKLAQIETVIQERLSLI